MAIVVEGDRGRVYLAPDKVHEDIAKTAMPTWKPETTLPDDPRNFWTVRYGLTNYGELFTPRQLVALSTFSDLVAEAMEAVKRDTVGAGLSDDGKRLCENGAGAIAYAEGIATYLALIVSRSADRHNTICTWDVGPTGARSSTGSPARSASIRNAFSRQSLPMTWDYAEGNPFSDSATNVLDAANWIAKVLERVRPAAAGDAIQSDAASANINGSVVSTDPPYYDNIGYADLSDFFYVWLRRSLRPFFPELFSTIAVPKAEELVATPYRHGSKEKAEAFFLDGMTAAMHRLAKQAHPSFPVTIYYAYKQSETGQAEGTSSTGWETFLDAVIRAGFAITGTWPMRTELGNRMIGSGTNALASSIVLVCRPRLLTAPSVSRRAFIRELNQVLPEALDEMTKGSGDSRSPVAPVDLSQAIIGPGMAVYSKYSAVLEADGSAMTVQAANRLINRFLAEDDFDADTQFCLHWFDQFGWKEAKFGDADTLARAKGTSVDGVRDAGVIESGGGNVRLFKWAEYDADWDPRKDTRLPIWEALHQLIRVFHVKGESGAGEVLAAVAAKAEAMRQLAYRLYTLCERSGRSDDARAYNEIITSWSAIETAASNAAGPAQRSLFEE